MKRATPTRRARPAAARKEADTNGERTRRRSTPADGPAADAPHGEELTATAVENGAAHDDPGHANGHSGSGHRRRTTVQAMAAKQRDISVSEFFAKNRHLLGFDNPRKALLTTIKEAVDNSLDACEEAGILPEIWVHVVQTGEQRYRVGVQDNGPGILKKQIPNIFGKLLYGSKFHRLRMSRGQQGIGISAAGMYGVLTTGQPVKILSKTAAKQPTHYYEIQIDTKQNRPEILNGKGEGVDIPPGEAGLAYIARHGIEWIEVPHGTRVTIELEAKYHRGRGSVDDYLEQTAIANPHVRLHYLDPDGNARSFERSTPDLPPEPKEIKPHPYGVELGMLVTMLKDTRLPTLAQFLHGSFSRISSSVASRVCEEAKLSTRTRASKLGRAEIERLYQALQKTRIQAPATDCVVPIGEARLLQGLHQVVPGEFYVAATRPPAVYRGNPFVIEAALAYGGSVNTQKISLEALSEMLSQSDARSLRQFLVATFNGLGAEGAGKVLSQAELGLRVTPSRLKPKEISALHAALQQATVDEGQSISVLRYANRVPLQFQQGACAITQTIMGTNWRAYGLTQSRGGFPNGPVTLMVHMASVWVPFTSESKEAVASYPEIQREIRLALQTVGRKLGMYLRRRLRVKHEGQRRNIFLRYLGEVAEAVTKIQDRNERYQKNLYDQLLSVAKQKTAEADARLDEQGKWVFDAAEEFGENVIIVDPTAAVMSSPGASATAAASAPIATGTPSTAAAKKKSSRRAARKKKR